MGKSGYKEYAIGCSLVSLVSLLHRPKTGDGPAEAT
jgi:hypothetical protein